MEDNPRRQLIRRGAFAGLVVLVLAFVVGGLALVVARPGSEPVADASASAAGADGDATSAAADDDGAATKARAMPYRTDRMTRDDEAPDPEPTEPEEPPGFQPVAPGFTTRTTYVPRPATDVREHVAKSAWPPTVVPPPAVERGHPERSTALTHRRRRSRARDGARTDAPARLVVRAFAAESGDPLPDTQVEVLQGSPADAVAQSPEPGIIAFDPLRDGALDVRVRHTGRVPWHETSLTADAGADLVLDVHLERGQVVEGTVTIRGDIPIEGARIRMWPADDWWAAQPFDDPPVTLLEAFSGEHGHFRIDAAPRLTSLAAEITGGEGLMTGLFTEETGPETDRPLWLDLLVTPAYEATGRITTVHGQPVSGAYVFAIAEELRGRWNTSTLVHLSVTEREEVVSIYQTLRAAQEQRRLKWVGYRATTNEDGAFTMPGLASLWSYRLFAIHPEHGRSEPSPPTAAAALEPYEASLRGLARVIVHVEGNGEPVDDAEIRQPWSLDTTVWPTSTPGAYGPVSAEVGPHVTEARHPEHPSQAYAGPLLFGIENHVRLVLPTGHVVTGRVIDLRDHYVEGATVTLGERTATTDIAGKFELRGVGAGPRTLRAEKDGLEARHLTVPVPGPAVDVRLQPLSVVTLQLVLPRADEKPTWVEAQAVTQRQDKWSRDPPNVEPVVSLDWNDGHVELRTVRGERGRVSVLVPGYQIVVIDVHPRGAETVELGRVQLVPARSVHGIVRGEGVGAIEGARVVLRPYPDLLRHALLRDHVVLTDADGAFRVDVPWAEGEEVYARVTAVADGFAPDLHAIDVGAVDIDAARITFDLVRGVVLRGTVVDADGAPVAEAFVGASWSDSTYTDAEGRFALRVREELPVTLRSAYDEGDQSAWRWLKIRHSRYVSRLFGTGDQAGLLRGSVEITHEPERGEELRIVLGITE